MTIQSILNNAAKNAADQVPHSLIRKYADWIDNDMNDGESFNESFEPIVDEYMKSYESDDNNYAATIIRDNIPGFWDMLCSENSKNILMNTCYYDDYDREIINKFYGMKSYDIMKSENMDEYDFRDIFEFPVLYSIIVLYVESNGGSDDVFKNIIRNRIVALL